MDFLSALLHSLQLYRHRAFLRKHLEWLDHAAVASDASNLSLTAPITLPDMLLDSSDDGTLSPEDGGIKLHQASRGDGQSKQPLVTAVTHPDTQNHAGRPEVETLFREL